jgi:hypothetical protein
MLQWIIGETTVPPTPAFRTWAAVISTYVVAQAQTSPSPCQTCRGSKVAATTRLVAEPNAEA